MTLSRILVLSDLHMTSGRNPATGTWSPTEDFFQDDEFARFLDQYTSEVPTKLVINGDLFDFLQVQELPDEWKHDPEQRKRPKDYVYQVESGRYDIPLADINPRYGLRSTAEATRFLLSRVVRGHETFFRALGKFIAHGENSVVILKGNHDIQLFWPSVQSEMRDGIARLVPELPRTQIDERIIFKPWFHYEPGVVWIEHGNQYEYTTSFVNFLAPTLPGSIEPTRTKIADNNGHVELDFSSFLVRYLTNRTEPVDPLADNIRPLSDYWRGLWQRHPFLVFGTLRAALVMILKVFTKTARLKLTTGWGDRKMSEENARAMEIEVRKVKAEYPDARLTLELLRQLDAAKAEPTMAHSPMRVLWWFAKPALASLLWLLPLVVVTGNVGRISEWTLSPLSSLPQWIGSTFNTVMQGVIIVGTGALLIGLRQYLRRVRFVLGHRTSLDQRQKVMEQNTAPPALTDRPPSDMRTMATWIARAFDVPFVTFGHTHYPDIHRLETSSSPHNNDPAEVEACYFNTGTWMTILEPREQLYREARQLTFLEIEVGEGGSPSARLRCWTPTGARPVVVVDLEEPDDGIENGLLTGAITRIGGLFGGGRR